MFSARLCSEVKVEGAHDGDVFLYLLFSSYLFGRGCCSNERSQELILGTPTFPTKGSNQVLYIPWVVVSASGGNSRRKISASLPKHGTVKMRMADLPGRSPHISASCLSQTVLGLSRRQCFHPQDPPRPSPHPTHPTSSQTQRFPLAGGTPPGCSVVPESEAQHNLAFTKWQSAAKSLADTSGEPML